MAEREALDAAAAAPGARGAGAGARRRAVLSLADRAQDGETDPTFVVPGAGGQTPGEVEDEPVVQSDLVVRRTQSVVAAEEAGEPAGKPETDQRKTRAQRGDTEPGTNPQK